MTTNDEIREALIDVWLMSFDADPNTWHESPWAPINFEIGQVLKTKEGERLALRLDLRLDR